MVWHFSSYNDRHKIINVLLINLSLADLLIGLYLTVIASANAYFAGTFDLNHEIWLRSGICLISCFLISVSTLMSTFIMFLITLDRYLYLVYPFKDNRLSFRGLVIFLLIFWIISITFTAIPIVYSVNQPSKIRLYGNNAACLPGNINNSYMLAWLLIYCGVTFITWIIISVMYIIIIIALSESRKETNRQISKFEKIVAAKMITIVATDLICWLPFYVVLINGFIHSELDIHTLPFIAILSLPLNSCINPIIYTIFTIKFIDHAYMFVTNLYQLIVTGSNTNLLQYQINSHDQCKYLLVDT